MIAIDSHWLPMDRTDIRENWERKKRKRGKEKSREEDPASFFSLSSPPSLLFFHLSFILYLQCPFIQYKMRIKRPLHIRHGIPISWVSLYETLCINIPMTTVMYCTNTHWIRRMIRTIYGEGRAGEGRDAASTHHPVSLSIYFNPNCNPNHDTFGKF